MGEENGFGQDVPCSGILDGRFLRLRVQSVLRLYASGLMCLWISVWGPPGDEPLDVAAVRVAPCLQKRLLRESGEVVSRPDNSGNTCNPS